MKDKSNFNSEGDIHPAIMEASNRLYRARLNTMAEISAAIRGKLPIKAIAFDVYYTLIPGLVVDPDHEFRPRKGLDKLLARCRTYGIKTAVTSDQPNSEVRKDFRIYGIDPKKFDKIQELPQRPKDFSIIMRLFKIEPWELLVIGDNYDNDIAGAMRHGARSVWVPEYIRKDDSYDLSKIKFVLPNKPEK